MRVRITFSVAVLGIVATGCSFLGSDSEGESGQTGTQTAASVDIAGLEREEGGLTGAIESFVDTTYTPFALDDDVAVTGMEADGRVLKRRLELRDAMNKSDMTLKERLPVAARRYVCERDFPRAVVAAGGQVADTYYRASGEPIGTIRVGTDECGAAALPPDAERSPAGSVFDADSVDVREQGQNLVVMANANAPRAISAALTFQRAELQGTRLVRHFRVDPTTERVDGNVQSLVNQDLCVSTPYRRFLDAGGVIRHRYEGRHGGAAKRYNVIAADCRGIALGSIGDRSWGQARYQTASRIIEDVGVVAFIRYLTVIGGPHGPGTMTRTRQVRVEDGGLVRELAIKASALPLTADRRRRIEATVCEPGYLRAIVDGGGTVRQVYYDDRGDRLGAHRVEPFSCSSGGASP